MMRRGLREGGVPAPLPASDLPPVIVADDDQDVRTMLRTLLELDGHEVIEAKDGDEAWKLCVDCVPPFPLPPLPAVIDLSLVAVALGSLLILRLAHGALPWGHLMIAVGPDGRLMRPRVKWHLWSISRGEPPRLAAIGGFASVTLGCAAAAAVAPRLVDSIFRPVSSLSTSLMIFTVAVSTILMPLGLSVLLRAILDMTARRSSMMGVVVGMRRDAGIFGRSYRIAVQAGDRAMAKRLWAESFRVDQATFARLSPGDRINLEYSPRLRYVYHAVLPEPQNKAVG